MSASCFRNGWLECRTRILIFQNDEEHAIDPSHAIRRLYRMTSNRAISGRNCEKDQENNRRGTRTEHTRLLTQ